MSISLKEFLHHEITIDFSKTKNIKITVLELFGSSETLIFKLLNGIIDNFEENLCSICGDSFKLNTNNIKFSCGCAGRFHKDCIKNASRYDHDQEKICPYCKKENVVKQDFNILTNIFNSDKNIEYVKNIVNSILKAAINLGITEILETKILEIFKIISIIEKNSEQCQGIVFDETESLQHISTYLNKFQLISVPIEYFDIGEPYDGDKISNDDFCEIQNLCIMSQTNFIKKLVKSLIMIHDTFRKYIKKSIVLVFFGTKCFVICEKDSDVQLFISTLKQLTIVNSFIIDKCYYNSNLNSCFIHLKLPSTCNFLLEIETILTTTSFYYVINECVNKNKYITNIVIFKRKNFIINGTLLVNILFNTCIGMSSTFFSQDKYDDTSPIIYNKYYDIGSPMVPKISIDELDKIISNEPPGHNDISLSKFQTLIPAKFYPKNMYITDVDNNCINSFSFEINLCAELIQKTNNVNILIPYLLKNTCSNQFICDTVNNYNKLLLENKYTFDNRFKLYSLLVLPINKFNITKKFTDKLYYKKISNVEWNNGEYIEYNVISSDKSKSIVSYVLIKYKLKSIINRFYPQFNIRFMDYKVTLLVHKNLVNKFETTPKCINAHLVKFVVKKTSCVKIIPVFMTMS